MMWSKVKSILRKLEARDNESLFEAIGRALSEVTARDAMGWFAHCGYNIIENALGLAASRTRTSKSLPEMFTYPAGR